MSQYLVRASFTLPYELSMARMDYVRNLIGSKGFYQFVSGRRTVSILSYADTEVAGFAKGEDFGRALQQIVDARICFAVHVTPVGERSTKLYEYKGEQKAAQQGIVFRLNFSGTFGPQAGLGEYAIVRDGMPLCVQKNVMVPDATNVTEVIYGVLQQGVEMLALYCDNQHIAPHSSHLALVSPSELVIKQLRGESKIEAQRLAPRVMAVNKAIGLWFNHKMVSFHLPKELPREAAA